MFQGFSDETFEFFMAIRFNNNREFFTSSHDWYLRAIRNPCLLLAEALAPAVEEMDENLERRPNKVVSRINRDIRFSNDKSPYRDYMWLSFRHVGEEKGQTPETYFDISDDGSSYGMGFYHDNRPLMNALRQKLLTDPEPFGELWRALRAEFTLHGDALKRLKIPESIPEDLRDWYALKGFYVQKRLTDFSLLKSPALAEEIQRGYRALIPLYRYFRALTPLAECPDPDYFLTRKGGT